MSNYRRSILYGGTFFFTVVTHLRRHFLTEPLARDCLKFAIETVRQNHPFKIVALCLLPDHVHCIMKMPKEDGDYSVRWSLIKKNFTRAYLQQGGREANQSESRRTSRYRGIWQKKFWEHRIKDSRDLKNHADYIHYNPVKHEYVDDPFLWPFSTVHKYYGEKKVDHHRWSNVKKMVLSSYNE